MLPNKRGIGRLFALLSSATLSIFSAAPYNGTETLGYLPDLLAGLRGARQPATRTAERTNNNLPLRLGFPRPIGFDGVRIERPME